MKVLVPIYQEALFIELVKKSYESFCEVDTHFNNFWLNEGSYDIIHLHWPEYLFKWEVPTDLELLLLKRVLNEWQQKGTKLVVTRHNYLPHRPNPERYIPLYNNVYMQADAVVHMGMHSETEYLERYEELIPKRQLQVQIPHPIFTNYPIKVSKEEARRHLNIGEDTLVMLVFGEVRKAAEKNLVLTAFESIKTKDKLLLVPGWKFSEGKEPINRFKWLQIKRSNKYRIIKEFIADENVQNYFKAANFLFLPRVDTLNSGVPFLAASFQTPIVGFNLGNIGEVLKGFGMPSVSQDNPKALVKAIDLALSLQPNETLYQSFYKIHSLKEVGKQHMELFQKLNKQQSFST